MKHGICRIAAFTPYVRVANPQANVQAITAAYDAAYDAGADVLVLPELSIAGYTCGDLFLTDTLLSAAESALRQVAAHTAGKRLLMFAGLPILYAGKLYNAAAAISDGRILGIVPKSELPDYGEFYERRYFCSGRDVDGTLPQFDGCPVSTKLLFRARGTSLCVAAEICEDLWVPKPPSASAALAGATVVVNLSASNETAGKADYRRMLVLSQSARLLCGYAYADAGRGESTTDLVFSGHNIIGENGNAVAECAPFAEDTMIAGDVDCDKLSYERARLTTFAAAPAQYAEIEFEARLEDGDLLKPPARNPFVPKNDGKLSERCALLTSIQAEGLIRRMDAAHGKTAVVGVSGGLDSALALLVAYEAFARTGRDKSSIIAVSMPGFGTTAKTRRNALRLASGLGVTTREIDITKGVRRHLAEIEHPENALDVTFENAQARYRTYTLMDVANQTGGLVIGTGDLSEAALGFCTYSGDHISMYNVNASVPKTLVRFLVSYHAQKLGGEVGKTLEAILSTEISPELLPPKDGDIAQKTEDILGAYEYHDFILYHTVRWGCPPDKVLYLAEQAFGKDKRGELKKTIHTFFKRFFANQFKRSCVPDGPKVGSVGLSPRGDWRMPSDADCEQWLKRLEED